jgi:Lipocalin-like domain
LAGNFGKSWNTTDFYRVIRRTGSTKDSIVDDFKNWPVCLKDNYITFKANHSRYYEEGTIRCDSLRKQLSYGGKWAFEDNYKTLNLKTLINESNPYEVVELTDNKLVLRRAMGANFDVFDSVYEYHVYRVK